MEEYAKKLNELKIPGVVQCLSNPIAEVLGGESEAVIMDITDAWFDFVKISRNALVHGFSCKDREERKVDFRPHQKVKITIDQIFCNKVTISKNVARCIFGRRYEQAREKLLRRLRRIIVLDLRPSRFARFVFFYTSRPITLNRLPVILLTIAIGI